MCEGKGHLAKALFLALAKSHSYGESGESVVVYLNPIKNLRQRQADEKQITDEDKLAGLGNAYASLVSYKYLSRYHPRER